MVMSKEDLIKLGTPAHATYPINNHSTYNSVENGGTNEKPVRIEILEPDVKEILSTCALYNLDQVKIRLVKTCFKINIRTDFEIGRMQII
jgi:hypothetical protein